MKSKRIRNALLASVSLALVAAMSAAITWAATFVPAELGRKENTLVNGDIAIEQDEPHFTFEEKHGSVTKNETKGDYEEGNSSKLPDDYPSTLVPSMKKGKTIARAYNPGTLVPKNPEIWNTKADTNVFVAMGLRYTVIFDADTWTNPALGDTNKVASDALTIEDSAYNNYAGRNVFDQIATLQKKSGDTTTANGICDGWTQDDTDTNLYYYNTNLAKAASATNDTNTTKPLFEFVKIRDAGTGEGTLPTETGDNNAKGYYKFKVSLDPETYYYTQKLPQFKISIKSYGVDANSFDSTTNHSDASDTALKALYESSIPTVGTGD